MVHLLLFNCYINKLSALHAIELPLKVHLPRVNQRAGTAPFLEHWPVSRSLMMGSTLGAPGGARVSVHPVCKKKETLEGGNPKMCFVLCSLHLLVIYPCKCVLCVQRVFALEK